MELPARITRKTKFACPDKKGTIDLNVEQMACRCKVTIPTMKRRSVQYWPDMEKIMTKGEIKVERAPTKWNWDRGREQKEDAPKVVRSVQDLWDIMVEKGRAMCPNGKGKITDIWQCRACHEICRFSLVKVNNGTSRPLQVNDTTYFPDWYEMMGGI